jgi:NhaP-type Na+/H+ or K+/H+ antiporter
LPDRRLGPLLIPAATRLQGIFFWDLVVYLLEGLVFLVTGLQIRTLLDRLDTIFLPGPLRGVLLTVGVVTARCERTLAVARQGVRGEPNRLFRTTPRQARK